LCDAGWGRNPSEKKADESACRQLEYKENVEARVTI